MPSAERLQSKALLRSSRLFRGSVFVTKCRAMLHFQRYTLDSDTVGTNHRHMRPRYIFGGDRWQIPSNPADWGGTYHSDVWKFDVYKQRWCCLMPDAQGA